MQIEINEEELREWAVNQIQKRIENRINKIMSDWDWKAYVRDAINGAVTKKITDEVIKTAISNIDKDKVIKTVSERIATEIADSFQN